MLNYPTRIEIPLNNKSITVDKDGNTIITTKKGNGTNMTVFPSTFKGNMQKIVDNIINGI